MGGGEWVGEGSGEHGEGGEQGEESESSERGPRGRRGRGERRAGVCGDRGVKIEERMEAVPGRRRPNVFFLVADAGRNAPAGPGQLGGEIG